MTIQKTLVLDDDDMSEYAVERATKSQNEAELQRLKNKIETVARKIKGKHEDFLVYNAMALGEQLRVQF